VRTYLHCYCHTTHSYSSITLTDNLGKSHNAPAW
jgi:hypothetical protein